MSKKKQVVQKYFDQTGTYLNDNMVIGLRKNLIINNLSKIENKEIIDIGCGNGEITLPYIEKNKVTFLDLSNNMLDIVRKRISDKYLNNAEIINQDFSSFHPGKKYDYLFLIGVLAHVESISKTISKLSELSNNDGIIILQYTNSKNLISLMLRITGYLKMLLSKSYGYKINYLSSREAEKILNTLELKCYKKLSYWPALPGFILMPKKVRLYFYLKILNSKILSSLGGEKILFIKPI
jgi:2-polyprenyl-3-methyl-5-hydroxy-6-metoxy-1,4-benzoquinol methylase